MARSSPQELARREQRRTYCGLGAMSFQTLWHVVPTTSVTESASAYEALTLFSLGLGVLMQLIARIHTFRWVVLAFVIVTLFILMAIAFATSVLAYSGIGKLMDTIYPRMSRRSAPRQHRFARLLRRCPRPAPSPPSDRQSRSHDSPAHERCVTDLSSAASRSNSRGRPRSLHVVDENAVCAIQVSI